MKQTKETLKIVTQILNKDEKLISLAKKLKNYLIKRYEQSYNRNLS